MHYVKLWSNLLKSSITEQELHVRWLWIALLLEADQNGNVYGTPEALARIANLPIEKAREALTILMAADPGSTTPDDGGARVLNPSPNLWHLVNYQKYRGIKDPEVEREKVRLRVQKHREQKRLGGVVTPVTETVTLVTPSRGRSRGRSRGSKETKTSALQPPFEDFYSNYFRKEKAEDALEAWGDLTAEERTKAISVVAAWCTWKARTDAKKYWPLPGSWIRAKRFNDEIPLDPGSLCERCHKEPKDKSIFCTSCLKEIGVPEEPHA